MNTDDPPEELVLRRSDVLRVLAEDARSKPEIVARTDNARSTVDRAVAELVEAELVARDGGCFRSTAAGEHLLDRFDEFVADANAVLEAREVLDGLEDGERLPPAVLRGAEVTVGDPSMPEMPVKRGMELLQDASHVRFCSTVQLDIYNQVTAELLLEDRITIETIYDPGRWEVVNREYGERYQRTVDTGNVAAYVADSLPSYTLAILERPDGPTVVVATHAEYGVRGAVLNDSPAAVAWAEERFAALRADAEQVVSMEEGRLDRSDAASAPDRSDRAPDRSEESDSSDQSA